MAIIYSYPTVTPKVSDLLVISNGGKKTKSASISSIIDLISTGLVQGTGTVTSVGVSAPSAFTVTNSPVTSTGTIAITGAGTTSQYIDGTGALQSSANQALDTTSNVTFSTITGNGAAITNIDKYTTAQVDGFLALKANQLTTYTKTEADTLLALKANQANTYTKTEADGLFSSGFVGAITPTSAAPTQDGLYSCSTSGTYTNFGGEVVSLSSQIVSIAVGNNQTTFTQIVTLTGMTFDAEGIEGSTNAITSDGVYKKLDVQPFIIDNNNTPNYNLTITEGSTITIEWTGELIVADRLNTNKYSHIQSNSGTRTITLDNTNTVAYIKQSEITLNNAGSLPVYYARWSASVFSDKNNIILVAKNKSNFFKDCTGILAEFIRAQLNYNEFTSLTSRVVALESAPSLTTVKSNVTSLDLYNRGNSEKEYSTTKKFGIITAGQSNTEGRVPLSTSPPSWYLGEGSPATLPTVKYWKANNKTWQPWPMPTLWAYDTEVYHELTDYLSQDIYVNKLAVGGTAISELVNTNIACWQPIFEKVEAVNLSKRKLTQEFEQQLREMKESSEFSNIEIKAFLWHQGEGDFSSPYNADYYQNFKNVISYVRGVLDNPILPIVFGTISHASAQYSSVVETAQLAIAAEDEHAYVVDMQNGTLLDPYHFDGVTSESLGQSMFNIIKDF
tara:strand:+ start:92 stop:2113 length:2022 start_codon:yes stop_codon:yes gene_type:complete